MIYWAKSAVTQKRDITVVSFAHGRASCLHCGWHTQTSLCKRGYTKSDQHYWATWTQRMHTQWTLVCVFQRASWRIVILNVEQNLPRLVYKNCDLVGLHVAIVVGLSSTHYFITFYSVICLYHACVSVDTRSPVNYIWATMAKNIHLYFFSRIWLDFMYP